MITWNKKIYAGIKAAEKLDEIKKGIEEKEFMPELYLVTLAYSSHEQLDIINGVQLHMPGVLKRLMPVVGVALGREELEQLIIDMTWEVYQATGTCALRDYFTEE